MKLNIDCVRSVLLAIENFEYGEVCNFTDFLSKPELHGYPEDDVQYTCQKLLEAGYIKALTFRSLKQPEAIARVSDLTYSGHEFLNTIRKDTLWEKTKSIAKKVGVSSLSALAEIWKQLASSAITDSLQHLL